MKTYFPGALKVKGVKGMAIGLALAGGMMLTPPVMAAGPLAVDLGSAARFTILAGAAVTTTGGGTIYGDVGASPITGAAIHFTADQVNGTIYTVNDAGPTSSVMDPVMLTAAKSALTTAYNDAANRTPVPTGSFLNPNGGNIGGLNLTPGLYKFTSEASITGSDVTLTGDADDVWIFQVGSALNVGNDIKVVLAGGAQAKNIFWQVGSSAVIGTTSVFKGTIMADQAITLNTGSTIEGRALAFTAGVTFNGSSFSLPTNNGIMAVGPMPIDLGSAADFTILSGAAITSTGGGAIVGDVGASPITGTAIGLSADQVNGTIYTVDNAGPAGSLMDSVRLSTAKSDLTIAYDDAAGRTPVPTGSFLDPNGANLGGLNLVPGLYKFTTQALITGDDLTLTGGADDVWVFQIGTALTVGTGINVNLAGGARAENIFWQVGSSAVLETFSNFKGTIMADQAITMKTSSTLEGRALAFVAGVTFNGSSAILPTEYNNILAAAGPSPVDLGSAAGFTILSGAAITTTGGGTIYGDVGASPISGSAIHFSADQVKGTIYTVNDAGPAASVMNPVLLSAAKSALNTAYNDAANRTPVPTGSFLNPNGANLGGLNLVPGLYKFTSQALITGADLTLTGGADDVWIFQIGSSLTVGNGIKVVLAGGAQAKNIFWQVGSSAVLETFSDFKGTIMADQAITMKTSSTIEGRALAFTAGVTFNGSSFNLPTNNGIMAIGPMPVDLGSAADFAILTGAAVTTTGGGTILGDVGASPITGAAIGFDAVQVNGTIYTTDNAGPAGSVMDSERLSAAKSALTTAYNDAADRTPAPTGSFLNPNGGNIGGMNLVPGLYKFTDTALITGADLTLTGGASDVWIFQVGADLQVGSGIKVVLAGGAQAKNIFWQVGTSAVLDTFSDFKGTILADQAITMKTSSTIEGRALAFTAGVTFNGTSLRLPTTNNSIMEMAVGPLPIDLGAAARFTLLSGAALTTTGGGTVYGDVGASPITGAAIQLTANQVNGTIYTVNGAGPAGSVVDPVLLTSAKSALTTAYNNAANRTPVPTGSFLNPNGANLGGMNLVPGLYKFTTAALITGADLTLTGGANDVWIFQVGSSLTVGNGIKVKLAGGAQAKNIFWQVGTSAVLGTTSVFKGTIMADQAITMNTGSTLEGRALAFVAAITFNGSSATLPTNNGMGILPTSIIVKANGATGDVYANYPETVSVTVEMTAGADVDINKDLWVVALSDSDSSWFYLNSAAQWTEFDGSLANVHPWFQGALSNLSATEVVNIPALPVGSYTVWFAVDSYMDGFFNLDAPNFVESVNVAVQ